MPGEGLEPLIFVDLIDYKICEGETESVYIYIYIDTKPLYKKREARNPPMKSYGRISVEG